LSEDWLDQSLAYSMQAKDKIQAVCDAVRTNYSLMSLVHSCSL
jgi:hypothetical protein